MDAANTPDPEVVLSAVGAGLPILLLHLAATMALLFAGVLVYTAITPFRERSMLEQGNAAAGTLLAGAVLALAIPLATLLATSGSLLDILVWGVVAVVLQLVTLGVVALVLRGLRGMIERGNVAAAVALAGTQVAVSLLNAAALVPN